MVAVVPDVSGGSRRSLAVAAVVSGVPGGRSLEVVAVVPGVFGGSIRSLKVVAVVPGVSGGS